jgi:hypothetical protein
VAVTRQGSQAEAVWCAVALQQEDQAKCAVQAEAAAEAEQPQVTATTDAESSAPLMVLYKDASCPLGEVPDPADEQQRFNQLCSYNILDTVGCSSSGRAD